MIYCFLSFDFFLSENIFKRCRPFERLSATFHNDLLGLLFLNVVGPSDVFGAFFAVQGKSSLYILMEPTTGGTTNALRGKEVFVLENINIIFFSPSFDYLIVWNVVIFAKSSI